MPEGTDHGVLIDIALERSLRSTSLPTAGSGRFPSPPELSRRGAVGPAADLFQAGRLLQWRLSGRAQGEASLPLEIPGWGTRATLELERLIAKAIQPDPARRFRSAAEFRAALERIAGPSAPPPREAEPVEVTLGRERELEAIESALRDAGAGRSRVLWFVGPPGIGKSRLLREARTRAQLRGLAVAECAFVSDPVSGKTLAEAIRAQRPLPARELRWLEPLRPRHGGTPGERAARAARAFFAEAGAPLVLSVDDAEAADRVSRLLLEELVREGAREGDRPRRALCLVGASQSDAPRGVPDGGVRRVGPLAAAAARELLRNRLRPLSVGEGFLRRAVARTRRHPVELHRLAHLVAREYRGATTLPRAAAVPAAAERPGGEILPAWAVEEEATRSVIAALGVLGRPARRKEIAAATGLGDARLRGALRRLEAAEIVVRRREAGRTSWHLRASAAAGELVEALASRGVVEIHRRVALSLESIGNPSPRDLAALARHRLVTGPRAQARRLVARAAAALRARQQYEPALALLEEAFASERGLQARLRLVEPISEVLERTGDHARGVELLEPLEREAASRLPPARRVRLERWLGVHCHRAGRAERALAVFEAVRASADPARDREELLFVDSELAELYTYRGRYEEAEAACRRGLARLEELAPEAGRRARLELLATLGHLELRRLHLRQARESLEAALRIAERIGAETSASQAVILNNLGIAHRQENRFSAARAAFRRAEALLARAGEGRGLVKIACNLAVLAALGGRRSRAEAQLERARRLARRWPGRRLEFFVAYTRGVVAQAFGNPPAVIEAFEAALPLGRELGDEHLVRHGEVYLAEAKLLCGRYREALARLGRLGREARRDGLALLERMALSRQWLAHALTGGERSSRRAAARLGAVPRSGAELPERWNDLIVALARLAEGAEGKEVTAALDRCRRFFRRVRVPAGAALAEAGIEIAALASAASARGAGSPAPAAGDRSPPHLVASVLVPLARAESSLRAGRLDRAGQWISRATGAMVGLPLLEADGWLEFLRGRLALRQGDRRAARRHLHRGLRLREVLLELADSRVRRRLRSRARMRLLDEEIARLERFPRVHRSTRDLARSGRYRGLIGRSESMRRVFSLIERIRDQDIPILLRGEIGTGKDRVAEAIHSSSARASGPWLAVHCGSLVEELFEAEFFGHEAGAYTGAEEAQPGLLESLRGGTLLLDDVGELTPALQAKLLRVLATASARRVGASESRPIDVRFLSATSSDLEARVERGEFRRDLLLRLRGVEIDLPPLRQRREDIAPLALEFLGRHARQLDRDPPRLDSAALRRLQSAPWRGNLRELEATLLRALVEGDLAGTVSGAELERWLPPPPSAEETPLFAPERLRGRKLPELKRELEAAYVRMLCRDAGGDLTRAMRRLGVRRTQFYARLKRLGLDPAELRGARCGPAPP